MLGLQLLFKLLFIKFVQPLHTTDRVDPSSSSSYWELFIWDLLGSFNKSRYLFLFRDLLGFIGIYWNLLRFFMILFEFMGVFKKILIFISIWNLIGF